MRLIANLMIIFMCHSFNKDTTLKNRMQAEESIDRITSTV
jgi:hypothetical protein